MEMFSLQVVPRIFADDLLMIADSDGAEASVDWATRCGSTSCTNPTQIHLQEIIMAFDATHAHLQAIGAKASPSKCYTFSSCPHTREC